MSDDVIKNNRRKINFSEKYSGYQPEHERLGVEPKAYTVNPMDFQKAKPRKKQIMPNSGNNEDLVWPSALDEQGKVFVKAGTGSERINYDNVVDARNPPNIINDLEEESQEEYSEGELQGKVSEEIIDCPDFSSVEYGHTIIIYKGSVLAIGDNAFVKSVVEKAVDQYGINVEDLVLLRRSMVKVGVFIDE